MAVCRHMVSNPLKNCTLSYSCLGNSSVGSVVGAKIKRKWTNRCNSVPEASKKLYHRASFLLGLMYSCLARTKQTGKALTHRSNKISLCIFFPCEIIDPRRDKGVQVSFCSLLLRWSWIICCELISVVLGNLLKQLLRDNYSEEIFWCGHSYTCIRV